MRRCGAEQHEDILKKTIEDLEKQEYTVVNLQGLSPSIVATKDDDSYAVMIVAKNKQKNGKWKAKQTLTYFEDRYYMFDKITRVFYKSGESNYNETLEKTVIDLENDGFRAIPLRRKSPDAIAIKNNHIYAIEILGMPHRNQLDNIKNWSWIGKKVIYDIFDGLMIHTFKYGEVENNVKH